MSYDQDLESPVEGDLITAVPSADALMALNRSEIDVQIATAKQFPRSIRRFKENAMEMACLDEETAASMFYVLPRGGKNIEGPSVRFAEIVGSSWGNLRYGARIVAMDDKFITAQGACMDLEKNIAATVEVKRRITNSSGKKYNDDMIQVTGNAACSVALRNAIFKVVPFGLVKSIYENAKLTSIGKAKTMQQRRESVFSYFIKAGATQEQILQAIDRKGLEDVTIDDLVTLNGLWTAIKDGETTIEESLGQRPDPKSRVRRSSLNDTETEGKADSKKPHVTPGEKKPAKKPEEQAEERAPDGSVLPRDLLSGQTGDQP